ncbi:MAG: sulfur carrier protein ThiS [Clostridia bacterium]|nr:sulfur carrier protein ThiS [Clostridia bacterium]
MVSINGEKVNADGMSISEYLANTSYDLKKIAIERNEAIVPKAKYDETVLCDGDSVEIVNFVGGG